MPISDEDWQTLRLLFKEAEDALSEAEGVCGELGVPAINQLRYAGHHILRFQTETDPNLIREEYQRAVRHCKRAAYDAYDSMAIYLLEEIEKFRKDYARVQIAPVVPNYLDIKKTARDTKRLIECARRDSDNRDTYYAQCSSLFSTLKGYRETLEDAREELNKSLRHRNQQTALMWLAIAATLITGIITFL